MTRLRQKEDAVLLAFKGLLSEGYFNSQQALIDALADRGFHDISQAKVSRMLSRIGAVKTRNEKNEMVYQLPNEVITPKTQQAINSMVLKVKHNGMQIAVKTILGGAPVIARILDTMGESYGILATISDDKTVLVVPTEPDNIEFIAQTIVKHLEVADFH